MNPFRKRGNSFEIHLIDRVRRYPYLYNSKDAHHVDSGLCLRTWQQIAFEMNSTTLQCKAKWRVLRCNFIRAYRQHAYKSGSEDQGVETDSVRPKWVYFNHLMFLEPFIAKRRPIDRLDLTSKALLNPIARQSLNSQDISPHSSLINQEDPSSELPETAKVEPTVIELDDENSQDNSHLVAASNGDHNNSNMKAPLTPGVNSFNAQYYTGPTEHNYPYQHMSVSSAPLHSTINTSGITPNLNFSLNRALADNVFSQQQQLIRPSINSDSPPKKSLSYLHDMTTKPFQSSKLINSSELSTSMLSNSEPGNQEDELFGKFVGTVLGSISGRNKGLARMEIQQILFKYQYD